MNFNSHSNLKDKHAFLSASKYHWINYDEEKLAAMFANYMASQQGTVMHAFAAQCISLGEKLQSKRKTLNMYVNDAIGFKMIPEQTLYYSDNCFGTADAIVFRDNRLRIHDLKTGTTPAKMEQLMVYAALFCLEYNKKPSDIDIELRIYQSNDVIVYIPDKDDIADIMNTIIKFDNIVDRLKTEAN